MKFLSILFGLCAFLSITWTCGGTLVWEAEAQLAKPTDQMLTDQSVVDAAKTITSGLGIGFFACTGLPAAFIFAVLAMMCNGAYQNERRHQEMLAAQYNRNEALGNMSTVQLSQAQMQFEQMQRDKSGNTYGPPRIYNEFPDEKKGVSSEYDARRAEYLRSIQARNQQIDKFKR